MYEISINEAASLATPSGTLFVSPWAGWLHSVTNKKLAYKLTTGDQLPNSRCKAHAILGPCKRCHWSRNVYGVDLPRLPVVVPVDPPSIR